MSKDNKKWECVRARLFKSGINSLRAHFLLAVLIFFGKNIFSYSLIFLIQFYMNRRSQICQNSITLHLLMIIRLGLKKLRMLVKLLLQVNLSTGQNWRKLT